MKCKDCPFKKWKECREKYPDYRNVPGTYCKAVKDYFLKLQSSVHGSDQRPILEAIEVVGIPPPIEKELGE